MSDNILSDYENRAQVAAKEYGHRMRVALFLAFLSIIFGVAIVLLVATCHFSRIVLILFIIFGSVSILFSLSSFVDVGCYLAHKEHYPGMIRSEGRYKKLAKDYNDLLAYHQESMWVMMEKVFGPFPSPEDIVKGAKVFAKMQQADEIKRKKEEN